MDVSNRKKVHLTINLDSYRKIELLSEKMYITKGEVIDEIIRYVLKTHLIYKPLLTDRVKLTTTVNPVLWVEFKTFADLYDFKYNRLIEMAMSKHYRNLRKKIRKMKKD